IAHLTNQGRAGFDPKKFYSFTRQKKFFFVSAIALLLALVINIFVTAHYKKQKTAVSDFTTKISQMQQTLNDANAAFLYHDESGAASKLNELQQNIKSLS